MAPPAGVELVWSVGVHEDADGGQRGLPRGVRRHARVRGQRTELELQGEVAQFRFVDRATAGMSCTGTYWFRRALVLGARGHFLIGPIRANTAEAPIRVAFAASPNPARFDTLPVRGRLGGPRPALDVLDVMGPRGRDAVRSGLADPDSSRSHGTCARARARGARRAYFCAPGRRRPDERRPAWRSSTSNAASGPRPIAAVIPGRPVPSGAGRLRRGARALNAVQMGDFCPAFRPLNPLTRPVPRPQSAPRQDTPERRPAGFTRHTQRIHVRGGGALGPSRRSGDPPGDSAPATFDLAPRSGTRHLSRDDSRGPCSRGPTSERTPRGDSMRRWGRPYRLASPRIHVEVRAQRMFLYKLEIQGFKSSRQDPAQLRRRHHGRHRGPNGCGRTNVSDAIRWVLGERSAKQFPWRLDGRRHLQRLPDARKPLSMAEDCTLTFRTTAASCRRVLQVTISRRVFRSGARRVLPQQDALPPRDIKDLFFDYTGMGSHAYP